MQKQQKKRGKKEKKRKRRRRNGDAAQARPGYADAGRIATVGDLGRSTTQAACDPCFCF